MADLLKAAQQALLHKLRAHIVWLAYGECRSPGWDGPPPTAREAVDAIDTALAAQAQPGEPAAVVPAGWRLERVSDGGIRVYGPARETWLIRKDCGEGFYDFVHRYFDASLSVSPEAPAKDPAPRCPHTGHCHPGFCPCEEARLAATQKDHPQG